MTAIAQDQRYESQITALKRICGSLQIDTLEPQIAALEEVLTESDVINVAVLGRFKAGKSSFLNSLVGKDVVPVGILPLTAAVTRIRYGPNDKAEVKFLNGQVKNVGFAELSDFIAEERNPENTKNVARVDLEISSLKDYPAIQFVDTPGLGSVYRHNTATSKKWLPRVGVAFLAISIDHPLSEDDVAFLRELESHTPEVHILLTKIDLVSSEEVRQVVSFIETQIQKKLGKPLRIFPFSNRPGFESFRAVVYQSIQSISANQFKKSKEIIDYKLQSAVSRCLEYLKLAVSAAASTEEARQLLRTQIRQELENVTAIKNELQVIGDNIKTRLRAESYEKFTAHIRDLSSRLIEELERKIEGWEGNAEKKSSIFWDWLKSSLIKHLESLLTEIGPQVSEPYLKEALSSFSRIARAFQDRVAQEIEKALRTTFKQASFEAKIERPKELDIHLYVLTMSLSRPLGALIPISWVRPVLKHRFISQIGIEAEKNLSRLSVQWFEAVSLAIDRMANETTEFIKNEITTVENILSESVDRRPDIDRSMLELNGMIGGA